MKYLFLIIVLLLCNFNGKLNNLENNRTLRKHFSENEIEILKVLVHSFENEILKNDSLNIIESYKLIYKKLNSFIQNEENEFIIHDYGIKHEKIFKEIDSSLFKEIWFVNYGVRIKDSNRNRIPVDTIRYVGVNINGSKYCDFLIDYVKKDRSIKDYVKGCILIGNIDCPMHPRAFEYFSNLDLKDETIRLISVIQLLCWLDTIYYTDYKNGSAHNMAYI
jgi:hypothetical protein